MTQHLHLDLVGGMAGDMTVAALVDAGASWEQLAKTLAVSGLPLTDMRVERERRGGLAGTRFHVAHEVDPPARHWRDIRSLLKQARLPEGALSRALDIFERLAHAEAITHGCEPEQIHFHEVGAMDSIVDIVASSIALDMLGITSASCSRIPVCSGSTRMAHGVLPLPAPATARLLGGFTLTSIPGTLETVTPTGAAILASLCGPSGSPHGPMPDMRLTGTGVGMGSAELEDRPNVLRVLVGEKEAATGPEQQAACSTAVVLEASIDDMDPRLYGEVSTRLFAAGALDVALLSLQMKKQRPGTQLQVVCRPALESLLTEIILRETTTLGVRSHEVRRTELDRRHTTVQTRFGSVRLKCGLLGEETVNISPEYDDCLARAREHDVPVKAVLAAAVAEAEKLAPHASTSSMEAGL